MASKRKKSRPTRIQETSENYEDPIDEEFMQPIEDTFMRIQRFLEEESVDTPDHVELAISQAPVSQQFSANSDWEVSDQPDDCTTDIYPETDGVVDLSGAPQFQQIISENLPMRIPNDAVSFSAIDTTSVTSSRAKTKPNPCVKTTSKRKRRQKDDPPRYSCSTCKYETNRSDHFKRHLMTHSEDKPLKCTICGYSTGRSDHYKRHLQRHGMTDQQVIEICERNGLKLKNAQAVLSEEDKLAKENGQQSNEKKALKVSKNTGSKYVCEECGYATDKSSHYHRHARSHVTERPYTCNICQKSFKLPRYLNKHRCSRLSKRTCLSCKSIFISPDALLEHHTNEHPTEDLPGGMLSENESDSQGKKESESKPKTEQSMNDTEAGSKVNGKAVEGMDQGNFFKNFTQMASEIISNKILPKKEPNKKKNAVASEAVKEKESDSSPIQDSRDEKGVNSESEDKSPNMQLPTIIVPLEDYFPCAESSPTTTSNSEHPLLPLSRVSVRSVLPPLVPSENKLQMGTLKCTKCETWFAKLDDYSTHSCT